MKEAADAASFICAQVHHVATFINPQGGTLPAPRDRSKSGPVSHVYPKVIGEVLLTQINDEQSFKLQFDLVPLGE